jgi:hypothetical protein
MSALDYIAKKDAELRAGQEAIDRLRRDLDALTRGTWEDLPDDLEERDRYRMNRAAFAAMNADFDFGSARRALQAARDRLVRADSRTTAGTFTGDASPKEQ